MGFVSRHAVRDSELEKYRNQHLKNALKDLTSDPNILAIYESGSLAKGNFDLYSDIDLHIVVKQETKDEFIKAKRKRVGNWGNVLFYEDWSPTAPVIVTHFDSFVKIDSWYKEPDELVPTVWLHGIKAHFDPHRLIETLINESTSIKYEITTEEVDFWQGKFFAFLHEMYRAVMREEKYYALCNLDRLRWLIVSGWYMEMGVHLDSPYGVWSKLEGKRSHLHKWQLSLLESWDCSRDSNEMMKTAVSMVPEFLRINKLLCNLVQKEENEEECKRIIEMVI
ncbi:nucleotidyltransferase domain-containing protein [Lederbergia citri]|uniref:Nucleotidyltransferase domain-containing protein n=1 Tax=Lederbergia citri TaxID=2833580 RepID=A0A942YFF6_9BACI|nr:nucleotidyltransferase domain-containing protein [Lederbergia citri]MBS4193579.1 nucleotidyltransferase domain-containing protein [Lederbergia citri]